jgi:hypothetical protein
MKEWRAKGEEGAAPLADVFDFADLELWKSNSFAALRPRLTLHVRAVIAELEYRLAYEIGRNRAQPFCGLGATKEHGKRRPRTGRPKHPRRSAKLRRSSPGRGRFWAASIGRSRSLHDDVLGIDIGLASAIALIAESGELIEIHDMPTLEDGPRNRATINAPLLAAMSRRAAQRAPMSNGSVRGPPMALCRPSPSGRCTHRKLASVLGRRRRHGRD